MVDHFGGKRRALPVLGFDGLHVVHEIDDERLVRAGVVITPDPGMAVGRHDLGLGEAHVLEVLAHHFGHLPDADVLRRDRRLAQPALDGGKMIIEIAIDVVVNCLVILEVGRDLPEIVSLAGGQVEARPGRICSNRQWFCGRPLAGAQQKQQRDRKQKSH